MRGPRLVLEHSQSFVSIARSQGRGRRGMFGGGDLVSTATHFTGLSASVPGALDLTMEFDRVLQTAADRTDKDTLPALPDPAADHGDAELQARRADVEVKHQRIRDFLDATNQD